MGLKNTNVMRGVLEVLCNIGSDKKYANQYGAIQLDFIIHTIIGPRTDPGYDWL